MARLRPYVASASSTPSDLLLLVVFSLSSFPAELPPFSNSSAHLRASSNASAGKPENSAQ